MPGIIPPSTWSKNALQGKNSAKPTVVQNTGRPQPILPTQTLSDTAGRTSPSAADQIAAMQQFLKNRGYNIAVDGIRGPQTNAAVLAFHQRVDPKVYNQKNAPKTTPPPSVVPPVNPPGKTPGKVPGKTPGRTVASAAPSVDPTAIDPAAWAAGQVNAAYDPQIAELARQQALGGRQAVGNQADIAAWYKQLDALSKSTTGQDAKAATDALAGYDTAAGQVNSLFGGQNSDPTFHDIQSGGIRANAEDQAAFDDHMRAILAAGGVQAGINQKRVDANSASELAAKMLDLRGAKGQAYGTAYQQGQQAATQQEAAQQSLALAKAMAPSQIAAATANATTAKVNASTAAKVAAANMKLLNAKVASLNKASTGGWDLSRPNDRGQLTSALRTGLQTKLGGFRIDPISAQRNLQQSLVQAGLANDPQAVQIANSLLQETLTNAHSKHLWGGFAWDGTKVVRSGKHFDPKTNKLVGGQRG